MRMKMTSCQLRTGWPSRALYVAMDPHTVATGHPRTSCRRAGHSPAMRLLRAIRVNIKLRTSPPTLSAPPFLSTLSSTGHDEPTDQRTRRRRPDPRRWPSSTGPQSPWPCSRRTRPPRDSHGRAGTFPRLRRCRRLFCTRRRVLRAGRRRSRSLCDLVLSDGIERGASEKGESTLRRRRRRRRPWTWSSRPR